MTFIVFNDKINDMITETLMNPNDSLMVKKAKGPVDAFIPLDDTEARESLGGGGTLRPGIFRDCAIFDDSLESAEQKDNRYDVKRLLEIQRIASQSEFFEDMDPSKMRLDELFLANTTNKAALVEAARKWQREASEGKLTEKNRELYSSCIDEAQEALYPQYDDSIAQSSINKVLAKIGDISTADGLVAKYGFMQTKEVQGIASLDPEVRKKWHDMLHERFDPIFQQVRQDFDDDGTEISNKTLPSAAKKLMKHLGMPLRPEDPEGWDVIDAPSRSGWITEAGTKTCWSGKRKFEITWESFSRLMMHEVVFHAGRAENGSRSGYDALQTGLPGSNEPEEGMSLLLEALWTGRDPDALGRDDFRYLAVAYADGKLDGIMHTEQETYDFTNGIMKASGLANFDKYGVNGGALDHTRRAFRGMPEGKILRSNYAYRAGKIGAIRNINESPLPPSELFYKLLIGKYDDSDAEQCAIVDAIMAKKREIE